MVTPYVGVWIETHMGISSVQQVVSLLMWECGLKHVGTACGKIHVGSLLMWECGLKHLTHSTSISYKVTPYVGVWIETFPDYVDAEMYKVTPYVGVWIETTHDCIDKGRIRSLLMWECGLKHTCFCEFLLGLLSLLMWECGLKRIPRD